MPFTLNTKVQTFLKDLAFSGGEKFSIVEKLLEICFNLHPDMTTDIKYGGLIVLLENKFVGGIFVYKNHVAFEFGRGYLMQDPNKVLLGNGKFRRHLKFEKVEEVAKQKPEFFIKQLKNLN